MLSSFILARNVFSVSKSVAVPTIVGSLAELLVTGSSQLEKFVVWSDGVWLM